MYMAQIAMEAANAFKTNPSSSKLEHFILKFRDKGETRSTLSESKAYWEMMTNKKAT